MSYRVFHVTVSRARKAKKATAASNWGTQDKPCEAQGLQEATLESVGERDPLANLRRLDEGRPGFHWRATEGGETPGSGKEAGRWQKQPRHRPGDVKS